jgi:hypothetical protein
VIRFASGDVIRNTCWPPLQCLLPFFLPEAEGVGQLAGHVPDTVFIPVRNGLGRGNMKSW